MQADQCSMQAGVVMSKISVVVPIYPMILPCSSDKGNWLQCLPCSGIHAGFLNKGGGGRLRALVCGRFFA